MPTVLAKCWGAMRVAALAAIVVAVCTDRVRAEVGAYLLFDMANGEIIAKHKASQPWYPASLTKLMTAYVTFAAVRDGTLRLDSPVKISLQARQQPPSRMGFALGTVITVETALRIILTKSANDVSVALAESVGGTQAAFVAAMNETARTLGMASTTFDNPHGLPNRGQITTARDMAVLMMALQSEFPDRADFFTMSGVRLGKRVLRNFNVLIRRFPGADGMKTGFICSSGFNLAASATRDGVRLGAVVLGGLTSRERDQRTAELLQKGFEAHRSGGRVVLDGFGDVDARLVHAPVSGERAALGRIADLPPGETPVVDLRPIVCGDRRPPTRYDAGTVATVEALEAQRADVLAWAIAHKAREAAIRKALSAPREPGTALTPPTRVEPPDGPARALSGEALRPAAWSAPTPVAFPAAHPNRERPKAGRLDVADFAPEGWTPAALAPPPHPLSAAGLREPLPEKPIEKALGYLGPARSLAPIAISVGGAKARPNASGPIVGGGPAPKPRARPEPPADETLAAAESDTDGG
ncbi:MAG: serine hydrolase [Pseudomonadota bacterium]